MGHHLGSKIKKWHNLILSYVDEKSFPVHRGATVSPFRKFVFFTALALRKFIENRGILRASSLAYTTLLAMIPLLAVSTSILLAVVKDISLEQIEARLDGFIEKVAPALNRVSEDEGTISSVPIVVTNLTPLITNLPPKALPSIPVTESGEVFSDNKEFSSKKLAGLIKQFIDNASLGKLTTASAIALMLVAIALLSTIEGTFNDIWGVAQGRSWVKRLVYYWAAITLGPLFLVLMGKEWLTRVRSTVGRFSQGQELLNQFGDISFTLFSIVAICLAFAALYMLMPNTRVHWKAALIGGLVGGGLWQLNNYFSSMYVSRAILYNKIYGALGMLPILLITIYFSWIFVLLGAQVSFVYQNFQTYLQEREADKVNQYGREFVAFRIMTSIGQRFVFGKPPPTSTELADELSISTRLVSQVMNLLMQAGLVLETTDELRYTLGKPPHQITGYDILSGLRSARGHEPLTQEEPIRDYLREQLDLIGEAERNQAMKITVQQMVEKANDKA